MVCMGIIPNVTYTHPFGDHIPAYYYRDYRNDNFSLLPESVCLRIIRTSIPILSLFPSIRTPISVLLNGTRVISSFQQLDLKDPSAVVDTALSVVMLGSVIFYPSISVILTSAQDLTKNAREFSAALSQHKIYQAIEIGARVVNSSLYIAVCLTNTPHVIIASLMLQCIIGIKQMVVELKKGNFIEASGEFFMLGVRSLHLKIECDVFRLQRAIDMYRKQAAIIEKLYSDSHPNGTNPFSVDFSDVLTSNFTDQQIIDVALQDHKGFVIGEDHFDDAAKRFLIQNMGYLKEKKVSTIFLEGFPVEAQSTIDNYIMKDLRELSAEDQAGIEFLVDYAQNNIKNQEGSPYTFFAMIEKAKELGIRIIGIDYSLDSLEEPKAYEALCQGEMFYQEILYRIIRIANMNMIAEKIMTQAINTLNSAEKFVALVGANHAVRCDYCPKVPSISDLIQVPSIILFGKDNQLEEGVSKPERIIFTSPLSKEVGEMYPFFFENSFFIFGLI